VPIVFRASEAEGFLVWPFLCEDAHILVCSHEKKGGESSQKGI
jgi:hypothetical protein